MWQVYVFNLLAALLIAGWYLRAVRRLERRMDARMRQFDMWADAEDAKFVAAREEFRNSMRAKVDRIIGEGRSKEESSERVFTATANLQVGAATLSANATFSPSTEQLPTEDEIRELPRWARVAFAARCASRVLPLVRHGWKDGPERHFVTLEKAVRIAERAASNASVDPDIAFATAAEAGFAVAANSEAKHPSATAAANSVAAAASAAGAAALDGTELTKVTHSVTSAYMAVNRAEITRNLRTDFETLLGLTKASDWVDETPVPLSAFGPLWPEGPPMGWPKAENTCEIVCAFSVPDELTTEDAIELAKELSAALCELHLAGGGHGLAIQPPLEITAPVRQGSPV